jgi:hypothetical protein
MDLGMNYLLFLSDNQCVEQLKKDEATYKKIRKLKRALKRKKKHPDPRNPIFIGKNWLKAFNKLNKVLKHCSNKLGNYINEITSDLSRSYSVVFMEKLNPVVLADDMTTRKKLKDSDGKDKYKYRSALMS